MKNKVARDIFTPIEDVFMLDINAVLDKETMELVRVHAHAHARACWARTM